MRFVEYADREMLAIDLANVLAGELENCLFNHEHASLAVPGGSTPGPVFDDLCAVDLDWSRVRVMPTDERWVPEAHHRSNARMIRERLLVEKAAEAVFIPLTREGVEPEDALEDIGASITPELPISIVVLGMGADMHTASMFPKADGLERAFDASGGPVAIMRPETQPEARITLTAPVLNQALSKHLIITGADKRNALEQALSLPPEDAPIQAVLGEMTVHWAE